jgi:hypothetical protein
VVRVLAGKKKKKKKKKKTTKKRRRTSVEYLHAHAKGFDFVVRKS